MGAPRASGTRARPVAGTRYVAPSCAKLNVNTCRCRAAAHLLFGHVGQVGQGLKVIVQPSNRRIFPDVAYQEAGAVLQEDLTEASVILAVKEVPIAVLIPNRTYCFFSHTKKAQVCPAAAAMVTGRG